VAREKEDEDADRRRIKPTQTNHETLELDGSFGEGGGQLLRTALYLSVVFNRAIHVTKIRAGRDVPGLRPQHAAVIRILADITNGRIEEGGEVGSTELLFVPGKMAGKDGPVKYDLGTAASITLVLQAVIPAVALSGSSLLASFIGGTDVQWSPTSDYLLQVVRPTFAMIGIDFQFTVARRGYYPRGGGKASVVVHPCSQVRSVTLPERGNLTLPASLTSRCGMLPRHVAERQASAALAVLRRNSIPVSGTFVSTDESSSPGSSVLISLVNESSCLIGADGIGRRGLPAERVGEGAANRFMQTYRGGATVDENLADSIAPVLCLGRSPSTFRVASVTEHLRTSLHVARLFTGAEYEFSNTEGESSGLPAPWFVRVVPPTTK
jgi:RNA 3'-phosphate cyclase